MHELLENIDIEPSNLSQQLAVLRRTSLVISHRQGGEVTYSISAPEVRDLLLAARQILSGLVHVRTSVEPQRSPLPARDDRDWLARGAGRVRPRCSRGARTGRTPDRGAT